VYKTASDRELTGVMKRTWYSIGQRTNRLGIDEFEIKMKTEGNFILVALNWKERAQHLSSELCNPKRKVKGRKNNKKRCLLMAKDRKGRGIIKIILLFKVIEHSQHTQVPNYRT